MKKTSKFKAKVAGIFLAITAGLSRACQARSGGVVAIYLSDAANVTSFTLNPADGTYSAVTMSGSSVFYKFDFKQDTGEWKDTGKMTNGAFSCEHMLESYWEDHDPTIRQRAQDIADSSTCGIIAIILDANGRKVVMGYNEKFKKERPLKLDQQEVASGKAFTDTNGSTPILKSTDNEYSRFFTGTIPV